MRRNWLLSLTILLLVLAACSGDDDSSNAEGGNGGDTQNETETIRWDDSTDHVVFRADVVGGENADAFINAGRIPQCTVYGDGRVIWVVDEVDPNGQVLFDVVTPDEIRDFVEVLAIDYAFRDYEAGANLLTDATQPVVETLTLGINDESYVTDIYGGWDIEYFEDVRNLCFSVGAEPAVYEPQGAWVLVEDVEYDTGAPLQRWDASVTGFDLAAVTASGEPRWVEGQLLRILWDLTRRNERDLQLDQNGETYMLALQIPNVTAVSPPAP